METKPIWQSKTFWFNVLVGVLTLLDANMHYIQQFAPEQVYLYIAGTVAAVNLFLRTVTKHAVGLPVGK